MAEVIYRCSNGHLYVASWAKAFALSVHLGAGTHLQRCPVDRHWRITSRVSAYELSEEQLAEARRHPF